MKKSICTFALAAGLAALASCGTAPKTEVSSGTLILNATIVDTRTGALSTGRAVVIQQGKITQILDRKSVTAGSAVRVVDGSGKYLVPGYLDMHVHSVPPVFGPSAALTLLLANGVTGVRHMSGGPEFVQSAKQFNAARAAGTQDVPEVVAMAGPVLAGIRTPADGIAAVQGTKAMGADFVKVVNASPPALKAILGEAKVEGMTVSGHLMAGISVVDAAGSYRSIEHLGANPAPVQMDCSDQQADIRAALLAGKGTPPSAALTPTFVISPFLYGAGDAPFEQQMMDTYNPVTCEKLAKTIIAKGVWQVPTLIRLHTMLQSDNPEFMTDPNLKYVDPTLKALWTRLGNQFTVMQPASAATTYRNVYGSYVNMLRVLRNTGGAATTLTGSDTGGIWVIPGFSLHQEFGELARAGFTPLEILQATTINGARFLNRESTMGTVEVNKNADLVLLDENPLADAANLSKIAGVVNAGKYFTKADLDAMKASIAAIVAKTEMRAESDVIDKSHKD